MKRRNPVVPGGADEADDRQVGRRALLMRGGVVAAGAAGAVVAGAAVAGPAGAATAVPVNLSEVNDAGTGQAATEITADNDPSTPTPTLILTNTGSDATTTTEASPNLRLTPAAAAQVLPAAGTVGGDVLAGGDGNLWFTHAIPGVGPVPATVHTDATDNLFVPLSAPNRILDTRSAAGRANVIDASGNLNSQGMLIGGKTIHLDLTSLVNFGTAVTANVTVTQATASGFITLWSGSVARPTASATDYAKAQTVANLTVTGIAEFETTTDTIAIFASGTTHVILDVSGFTVNNAGQVNPAVLSAAMTAAGRAKRAHKAATTPRNFKAKAATRKS